MMGFVTMYQVTLLIKDRVIPDNYYRRVNPLLRLVWGLYDLPDPIFFTTFFR